ncbi:hypothetical protein DFQ28_007249 [Apophysomyces sp. BC1034]|nr:hypothetical protein DFQ30_006345 [Apophysomyces sp. BC1015]KAG0182287.1 hypothetical protein DFQ29_005018 [Apophysomyces sp. BC1021]KAG0192906.1 hypothetical protein DFQ28_007249 [Apophysomyces sp. BC1034]
MSEQEITESPTDRTKRPRLTEEEWDSDYERDGQDDRHPKRQAVTDPETKAPHFAGTATEGDEGEKKEEMNNRGRRKKWEEYGRDSQESDDGDEVQIVLDDTPSKSSPPRLEAEAQQTISIRSLVNSKDAGVIIGRGGKNVSEIREMSTARVTISDIIVGAVERILTVTGPLNAVAKAYGLVGEKILLEQSSTDERHEQTVTLRILVPGNRMGTLIGRGGSVIRSIQEQSSARLNASEEPLPMSTERTITITGTPGSVQVAIYKISEILLEHPDRSTNNLQYRPQPQMGMNNRGYHSMARSAASAAMGGYAAMMGMTGMPMNGASQFYYPPAAAQSAAVYGNVSSSRQADYSGMAGMAASSQAQQIFIPNEMVGCIIGKGGSKINEIRQLSGSHIKIADPHGDTNERLVTITGTPESNQMALYLLYSRLESEKGRLGMR